MLSDHPVLKLGSRSRSRRVKLSCICGKEEVLLDGVMLYVMDVFSVEEGI